MIPSLNRQDVTADFWPKPETRWTPEDVEKWQYFCDCCTKHVRIDELRFSHYWSSAKHNPRLIRVCGVTYYGCSTECARILFNIHQQYALASIDGHLMCRTNERDSNKTVTSLRNALVDVYVELAEAARPAHMSEFIRCVLLAHGWDLAKAADWYGKSITLK